VDDRQELSRRLRLLREQLEQLVCALDIQQLLLTNHRPRLLPVVTDEVERLVDDIRASEAKRTMLSARIATELGLAKSAPLTELIEAIGEPYQAVWHRHHLSLLALHAEIEGRSSTNRSVGLRGLVANREMLTTLSGEALDVTTHNGANATTPSHHRQRVHLEPTGVTAVSAVLAGRNQGTSGGNGVSVDRVLDKLAEQ
jgi:hypothetical protein